MRGSSSTALEIKASSVIPRTLRSVAMFTMETTTLFSGAYSCAIFLRCFSVGIEPEMLKSKLKTSADSVSQAIAVIRLTMRVRVKAYFFAKVYNSFLLIVPSYACMLLGKTGGHRFTVLTIIKEKCYKNKRDFVTKLLNDLIPINLCV